MAAVERGMRAAGKRGVSPLHGHHPSHHPGHHLGHPSHNPCRPGHLSCLRHPDHWLHHINSGLLNAQDIKPAVSSSSDSGICQVHITLPFFFSSTEIDWKLLTCIFTLQSTLVSKMNLDKTPLVRRQIKGISPQFSKFLS